MNTLFAGPGFALPRPLPLAKVQMQDFHFTMRIGSPLDAGLSLFRAM